MLIDLKELSPVRRQAEIEIPADAIATEMNNVTGEFARSVKVPGFRPGKVPVSVVRSRFQKDIEKETLERLVPRFFFDALSDRDLRPVGSPGVTQMGDFSREEPVRFTAEFEIRPDVRLREWRGIEASAPAAEVTEADIDKVIDGWLDNDSTLEPAPGRPAQEGDVLLADVESSGEGMETRTSEEVSIRLGEGNPIPAFNENLFGRNAGEVVEFDHTFGEDDAPNSDVRGKTVHYKVTVREIRTLVRPVADDEFAKKTGFGDTVAELREKIREDLKGHKEQEAQQARREEVARKLVEMHEVPTPQSMVEDELGKAMREYARFLQSRGVNLEYADVDWQEVQKQLLPGAENRVRRSLILDAIAKEEGITVTDVEVDAEIRQAANASRQEFAEVKHRLRHDGGYEALRASMVQERAFERVLEAATNVAG